MTNPRAAAVEAAAEAMFERIRSEARIPILNTWARLKAESPDSVLYTSTVAHAQTAITAYLARMAEAGWVMVPREATQEMLPQAWRTIRHHGGQGVDHDCLRAVWSAMVRAAMLVPDHTHTNDPPRADGEGRDE